MIYYLLLGVFWTAFVEFVVNDRMGGEPFNNMTRLINVLIWPLAFCIFIYGIIRGYRDKNNDN